MRLSARPRTDPYPSAERGQGLTEFALILPLLLVLLLGVIEFGRVFFIYSEVSSAVREAIRFGVANPYDCAGIRQHAASTLTLTRAADISLTIAYDDGASTFFTFDAACSDEAPELATGDRVTISAHTTVRLLTGDLIGPIVRQTFPTLPIDYTTSRTIVPTDGIETGPTSTPLATRTPRPGASPTPTNTPTPTATPTPLPPNAPINFNATVQCQNKNVDFSWSGVPSATSYRIYNADTGALIGSTTTSTSCNNCDNLGTSQTRGYTVVAVNAGGQSAPSNVSRVTCGAGATDTPTPTATPTHTPTPSPTPTNTLSPTPSDTPRPTRTATPTLTGSETPTQAAPSPTATQAALKIAFYTDYPLYNKGKHQFWIVVRVTNPVDYPVIDADVRIVEPASYSGLQLTHISNGLYGLNGSCFGGNTTGLVYVRVSADRFSYASAEVTATTTETNLPKCPMP